MTGKKTIDFTALTRGLLQDLLDMFSSRPPRRVQRSEGSGIGQIEQVVAGIRTELDVRLEPIEAVYRERAEGNIAILTERRKRIEAYAKRERRIVTADSKKFIVAGRVFDTSTGIGVPNVGVSAVDVERKYGETLGSIHTDALGYFRLEYTATDLEKLGEKPQAFIEVRDDGATAIFRSQKAFALEIGGAEFVSAGVDGNKVPAKRDLGQRIDQSVSGWIEGIQKRIRVSAPRADLPLRELSRGLKLLPQSRPKSPKVARPVMSPADSASLEGIKGIGGQFASRLVAAGITAANEVAKMKPARLARILRISVSRAESIVGEALRVAKRP